jgi:hypothetical protein
MTICDGLGLRRAGNFAFEQVVVVSSGSTDLRWALVALALQSLGVLWRHLPCFSRHPGVPDRPRAHLGASRAC